MDAAGPPLTPVPDNATDCGLPAAPSVTEIAAARAPVALGVNTAVMVQFEPAATKTPQLFVCEKSPAFAPVIAMLETGKSPLPVLNRVTPPGALLAPKPVLANVIVEMLKVTIGAVPVPLSVAVCGLPDALSITETAAVRVPEASGVNVILIVQLVAAASEVPQLLLCAKSSPFVPVTIMEVMLNAALPVLFNVSGLAPLVVPTA